MSSTAPEEMALSAMLKVYQWWLRQYQSMKSTTLPKRNRSTRLPIAPPATRESAMVSRRLSRPQRRRKTTITPRAIAVVPTKKARRPNEGAPAPRPNTPPVLRLNVRSKKPGMTVSGGAPGRF